MELRKYQTATKEKARRVIASGKKRVIIHAPTGAGKTIIAADIIRTATEKKSRTLFLANRRELIKQSSRRLRSFGVDHGIIMAGIEPDLQQPVQIASVQTYVRRMKLRETIFNPWFLDASLIIYDEAHGAIADTPQKIFKQYPKDTVILGLTATPARGDGRGLGEFFQAIVSEVSFSDLIKEGYLVRPRYFDSDIKPDLSGVGTVAGDYNKKQLGKKVNTVKLVGDVFMNWSKIAPDRQTVIFAVNVAHSIAIRDEFLRNGVKIEHMDAHTPSDERDMILRDLETGDIQCVTNVGILGEGMDFPIVSCIVLARPTKSLPLYIQMAGRGARPYKGKEDFLLIDHGFNIETHGFLTDDFFWTLDSKKKAHHKPNVIIPKEKKPCKCRACNEVFQGLNRCPVCGTKVEAFGKKIVAAESELREIKTRKNNNKKYSKELKLKTYQGLISKCYEKGYAIGWAAHAYKDFFGVWPNAHGKPPALKPPKGSPEANIITHIVIKKAMSYKKKKKPDFALSSYHR